ncbi:amidohydrolase [Paenibacillus sp. JCM 10914]|uniref:amidohydrolase n=1 Tax=Paenibacillus sp. JCM 10914 TaxID=1236974 RepID=UPI0003CC9233|nr:amidohydrolase [Paenibacillus sp. JCM 10914]GAE07445.1 S-adenosylhomocysteine deaminase [Paenibacillus sp. JCM 10914]
MSILIKNATILTMNDDAPFTGDIRIEGEDIVEIRESIDDAEAKEVIEATGMAAMPGLINAHQHTPMSLLRGFSDDLRLMDWLEKKMLPAESRMTPEDIYWGAKLSMAEMIRSGTTTFADMYIHMNEIAMATAEVGMRASLTRGLVFQEDDGGKRISEALELIHRWHGKAEGRITTMLGPHSPYTCPTESFKDVIHLAENMNIPIHTHLAETIEEVVKIKDKYNQTPTEFLYDLGLFEKTHAVLAHSVHLNDRDITLLKGMRGGVSHNPVSNLKLGCGIAPVLKLIQQGINVGIGTDGAGSATTVDMFEEIKAAAWLQKLEYGDPTRMPANQALSMATRESAKLLNIHDTVGTLQVGKKADVILIDCRKPHLQPIHSIQSLLAYSANGGDVDTTIVNGKILMRHRHLLTMDEDELFDQVNKRSRRITQEV